MISNETQTGYTTGIEDLQMQLQYPGSLMKLGCYTVMKLQAGISV